MAANMVDCIICSAAEDEAVAGAFRRRLIAAGFSVWSAGADMRPGPDWREQVNEAMNNALVALVLLSPDWNPAMWEEIEAFRYRRKMFFLIRGDSSASPADINLRCDDFRQPGEDKWNGLIELIHVLRGDSFAVEAELPCFSAPDLVGPAEAALHGDVSSHDMADDFAIADDILLMLGGEFDATPSDSDRQAPAAEPNEKSELIGVTAFAPDRAPPGSQIIVQAAVHLESDRERAEAMAKAADPAAKSRASIKARLAEGVTIGLELVARDLAIDEPAQAIVWEGDVAVCFFVVSLPPDVERTYPVRMRVSVATIPLGSVCFTIAAKRDVAAAETMGHAVKPSTRAFLSYASEDRLEVLKRSETLALAGIECFQDIASLRAGEKWEARLYEEINACDLFLLFWSSHAARSSWVVKEAELALKRQIESDAPDIIPVILEGPPIPPPPKSLEHLHFNSLSRYLISGAEKERDNRAASRD